ncbi:unnamed protein product, partial [Rotaria sp. Silwood2]
IVQNDEVKEEIVNDDQGIPLIARCAYDRNFDFDTIRRPAWNILDHLLFVGDNATEQIYEIDYLMDDIHILSSSNDTDLSSTTKRMQFKIEQEASCIIKQNREEDEKNLHDSPIKVFNEKKAIYQYVRGDYRFNLSGLGSREPFDLMISYCPFDKGLCSTIYSKLKESKSYRISFDEENNHESNPIAMADIVGRSSIILFCFSNKYRQSNASRLEAEFAKKRKRKIIPIRVERYYEPTGWLLNIIGDRECVDFTQGNFIYTYNRLIERIDIVIDDD